MTSLPPAGWYPDPDHGGENRYWTGTSWAPRAASVLEAEQPLSPASAPAGESSTSTSSEQAYPWATPAARAHVASSSRNTTATVALVLGIVALVLGIIPYLGFVTWVIAIPAAILGAVALRSPHGRGRAIAGLLLGITSLVLGLVISLAVAAAVSGSGEAPSDAAPAAITTDSDSAATGADAAAAAKAERADLRDQLEASIEKDAKKDVAKGLFEGPVLDTSCTPVSGSDDPLTDQSTTFTCFVSTSRDADGTERGVEFAATMNWEDGSYSWRYQG